MIYTVTLNPAIDYFMDISAIKSGQTNRSASEEIRLGGKGINVSRILAQLGHKSVALGFTAGFTGDYLEKELKKSGIDTDFTVLEMGFTRINIKLNFANTEINATGPDIDPKALSDLLKKINKLSDGDTLVLSGSIPRGLSSDIYEQILINLSGRSICVIVDASGRSLEQTLKYRPFLVKPNIFELQEISGKILSDDSDIISAALDLKAKGAENVLVSLGAKGAVLIDRGSVIHRAAAIGGEVDSTVGCGDSMVAGFIAGADQGISYAFNLACAAGNATALSGRLAEKTEIFSLLDRINKADT